MIDQILSLAQAPARGRVEHYAKRLDEYLALQPAGERRGILDRELSKWEERYRTWAAAIDNNTATKQQQTYSSWDFILTIAEIDKRRGAHV